MGKRKGVVNPKPEAQNPINIKTPYGETVVYLSKGRK